MKEYLKKPASKISKYFLQTILEEIPEGIIRDMPEGISLKKFLEAGILLTPKRVLECFWRKKSESNLLRNFWKNLCGNFWKIARRNSWRISEKNLKVSLENYLMEYMEEVQNIPLQDFLRINNEKFIEVYMRKHHWTYCWN